jgi:hypothetical protein
VVLARGRLWLTVENGELEKEKNIPSV